MTLVALPNTSWKPRFNRDSSFRLFFFFVAILGALSAASVAIAQSVDRPCRRHPLRALKVLTGLG